MAAKIIQLGSKDDLASLIKQIKTAKEREVVLEVEKGSRLLTNQEALRLIKKTADVLGKKLKVETVDQVGPAIPKAGPKNAQPKNADIKPRFSDIKVKRTSLPVEQVHKIAAPPLSKAVSREATEDGSRLAIEMDSSTTSKFSKIFILCLIVLVIAVFGLAVLLPKADITVFARSEPVTRDFELSVDKAIPTANKATLQIPGISISKEVSVTKSFPTTGIKTSGTKTGGVVTIYNNTPNTLKFNASTTTLVAGGKKFVLVKDISGIRAGGVANTGIAIAATEAGAEYNLPANTRFQIVNAALGNANVYAVNPQALGGGSTGSQTKILSQQDIDSATTSIMADVLTQAETELSTTNRVKMRLLESAAKQEVLAKTADKNVGAEVSTFNMTMISKVTGLAFREEDVLDVVVSKINEVLSSDKYLLDNQQKPFEASFKSVDLVNNRGVLAVHFETVAAYKVDDQNLTKILAGKNDSEIKEILLSKPELDKVEVKFWPEWFVHKAPKFNGKININTVLSEN